MSVFSCKKTPGLFSAGVLKFGGLSSAHKPPRGANNDHENKANNREVVCVKNHSVFFLNCCDVVKKYPVAIVVSHCSVI